MTTLFFKDVSIIQQEPAQAKDADGGISEVIAIVTDSSEVLLELDEMARALEWHGYTVAKSP